MVLSSGYQNLHDARNKYLKSLQSSGTSATGFNKIIQSANSSTNSCETARFNQTPVHLHKHECDHENIKTTKQEL